MIVFYLYAVVGVNSFRDNDPVHFRTPDVAFVTLFRCTTLEDWTEVVRRAGGSQLRPVFGDPHASVYAHSLPPACPTFNANQMYINMYGALPVPAPSALPPHLPSPRHTHAHVTSLLQAATGSDILGTWTSAHSRLRTRWRLCCTFARLSSSRLSLCSTCSSVSSWPRWMCVSLALERGV